MRLRKENPSILPTSLAEAYFPPGKTDKLLSNVARERAGENLVGMIEYGSHVTGDATSTSRRDMILIVKDTEKFHRENMSTSPKDYGRPRSVAWHTFLNKFGFNFYLTSLKTNDGQNIAVKYAVISSKNFITGCSNGDLELYVAGRMQKVALRPHFYGDEKEEEQIKKAINTARIDGVTFALGLQEKQEFNFDTLLHSYVSLSYLADVRIEKPDKIATLIEKSKEDYIKMLTPIIDEFVKSGLIEKTDYGLRKAHSLSQEEVETILKNMKLPTAIRNFGKNTLTVGFGKGIIYAGEKIIRTTLHNRRRSRYEKT